MKPKILTLEASGQPTEWLSAQQAVTTIARGAVLWSIGEMDRFHGGWNHEGEQTIIDIPAILALRGTSKCKHGPRTIARLTNKNLFSRDDYQCQYCGLQSNLSRSREELNRDHIYPTSLGGKNVWTNVVASCKRCNSLKGHKTLDQLGWDLIAVPYTPNYFEEMCLKLPLIAEDQLSYLYKRFTSDRMKTKYADAVSV